MNNKTVTRMTNLFRLGRGAECESCHTFQWDRLEIYTVQ